MLPLCCLSATIVVLGDSLSAGYGLQVGEEWPALLDKRLSDNGFNGFRVVNASISGETTSGGLARLDAILQRQQPALLLLQLGANDGLRGQPLDLMRSNLAQIIERARQAGAQVVLLGIRIPPNYGSRYSTAFFNTYAELAGQYRLPVLPFLLEGVAGNDTLMQNDGLHPTADAQPIILDNVWQALRPLLGEPGHNNS
ncbi:MAG TPA: arylesterase [Pseudomonadales bacterium]